MNNTSAADIPNSPVILAETKNRWLDQSELAAAIERLDVPVNWRRFLQPKSE